MHNEREPLLGGTLISPPTKWTARLQRASFTRRDMRSAESRKAGRCFLLGLTRILSPPPWSAQPQLRNRATNTTAYDEIARAKGCALPAGIGPPTKWTARLQRASFYERHMRSRES
jgi:hypothetical protein